jgi:2-dehydro-3-deoxygalactonokinase
MVVNAPAFLAVDWGTTNRRVYAIGADGAVLATERDGQGLLATPRDAFAGEVAGLRRRFGEAPTLCAGMVGSARGWEDVPYVDCPAGLDQLAARLRWVEPGRTAIVPGVAVRDLESPDVMRGEEVQLLGAVASGAAPDGALLCQPGTHCKWARVENERIISFRTAMTGELFSLLRASSLLAPFLDGPVEDGPDFRAGVALARRGHALGALFGERAGVLLGFRESSQVAARVSGLLIGEDVRGQALARGETVYVLADPVLGGLYVAAIEEMGGRAVLLSSHDAFVAGINRIWRLSNEC